MECTTCFEEHERTGDLCCECLEEHLSEIGEAGQALAEFLGVDVSEVELDESYRTVYKAGGRVEYLVLTDSEADDMARERVENFVDECVLSEIPEPYRYYFDTERFIEDVLRHDGRGPQLAGYDSSENEILVGDTWYFIYAN